MHRSRRLITLAIAWCLLSAASAESLKHTVQPGETLFGIARKYRVSLEALLSSNQLKDQQKIKPGLVLSLPGKSEAAGDAREYVVQKGDSLYGLAKKTGVPVKSIMALNKLKMDSLLKPGDKLKLEKAPSAPPTREPAQAEAKELKPVAAPRQALFFWPHSGSMKELEGKLVGVTFQGNKGDPVYSISSGQIVWIGPYRGYGKVVFVQSEQGYIYVYAGNEELEVRQGESVAPGKRLGSLGVNPYERSSTLYFIVYKDGRPVRPREAPRI